MFLAFACRNDSFDKTKSELAEQILSKFPFLYLQMQIVISTRTYRAYSEQTRQRGYLGQVGGPCELLA